MNFDNETEKLAAFELVAEALEYLDRYQQSLNRELLKEAETCLQAALKEDPNYFKARYFQAMVSYLSEGYLNDQKKTAADQFGELGKLESLGFSIKDELKYNRGAACYQEKKYVEAIAEFQNVRKSASFEVNPELYLLASAGAALAHARIAEQAPEIASHEIAEVNSLNQEIIVRSRRPFIEWLLPAGPDSRKGVDPEVARKARLIAKKASRIASNIRAEKQGPIDPPISVEPVA